MEGDVVFFVIMDEVLEEVEDCKWVNYFKGMLVYLC